MAIATRSSSISPSTTVTPPTPQNVSPPPGDRKLVKLAVIVDTTCPWCYISAKEMDTAIARAQAAGMPLDFDVEMRPFRLDETLSETTPLDRDARYLNKFGAERYATIKKVIGDRGQQVGIDFTFSGPIRRNGPEYRLLRYAYTNPPPSKSRIAGSIMQRKLAAEIYKGFFEQGQDIADHDNLARYAEAVGLMSKNEALAFLSSDQYADEVEALIQEAREDGVSGVPMTIINNKWAVSGGQSAEVYYGLFEKMAKCMCTSTC